MRFARTIGGACDLGAQRVLLGTQGFGMRPRGAQVGIERQHVIDEGSAGSAPRGCTLNSLGIAAQERKVEHRSSS